MYFKELREEFRGQEKVIWFVVLLFVIGFFSGILLSVDHKMSLFSEVQDRIADIQTDNVFLLLLRIIVNNVAVALFGFLLGFTLLVPIGVILLNGVVLGVFSAFISKLSIVRVGMLLPMLLSLFTHGIFEIPAIILAMALGVSFGLKVFWRKQYLPKRTVKKHFKRSVFVFLGYILPLLLLAGLIEVFVTSPIAVIVYELQKPDNKHLAEFLPSEADMGLNVTVTGQVPVSFADVVPLLYDDHEKDTLDLLYNYPTLFRQYGTGNQSKKVYIVDQDRFSTQEVVGFAEIFFNADVEVLREDPLVLLIK